MQSVLHAISNYIRKWCYGDAQNEQMMLHGAEKALTSQEVVTKTDMGRTDAVNASAGAEVTGIVDEKMEEKEVTKITEEMLEGLYPVDLKGLGLSFDESIYAIAFELQKEIRAHGKESVFAELDMTESEMRERVEHCLNEAIYKVEANALRLVLGDRGLLANCKENYSIKDLKCDFAAAVNGLREGRNKWNHINCNYRYLLVQGGFSKMQCDPATFGVNESREAGLADAEVDEGTPLTRELYAQVQQLMEEVRFYDAKRDLTLMKIEELMSEIQRRQDCPKDFGVGVDVQKTMELDGPITQIAWPYRSLKIIQGLYLQTVREVVEYFCNFGHFLESEDLTLMEWSVMTSILHRKGLLPKDKFAFFGMHGEIDELELSVRLFNNLRRAGINEIDDIVFMFADGATAGLDKLEGIRNLGRKSCGEMIQKLSEIVIEMDDALCYPTVSSHIRALDFNKNIWGMFEELGLETIGDLVVACQNQNRFSGLRYLDYYLYNTALLHLRKYGILRDSCNKTPL